MLKYGYFTEEEKDSVAVSEKQMKYMFALGLCDSCRHIGK